MKEQIKCAGVAVWKGNQLKIGKLKNIKSVWWTQLGCHSSWVVLFINASFIAQKRSLLKNLFLRDELKQTFCQHIRKCDFVIYARICQLNFTTRSWPHCFVVSHSSSKRETDPPGIQTFRPEILPRRDSCKNNWKQQLTRELAEFQKLNAKMLFSVLSWLLKASLFRLLSVSA